MEGFFFDIDVPPSVFCSPFLFSYRPFKYNVDYAYALFQFPSDLFPDVAFIVEGSFLDFFFSASVFDTSRDLCL